MKRPTNALRVGDVNVLITKREAIYHPIPGTAVWNEKKFGDWWVARFVPNSLRDDLLQTNEGDILVTRRPFLHAEWDNEYKCFFFANFWHAIAWALQNPK